MLHVWLLLLNVVLLRFIHIVACISSSLSFIAQWYSITQYATVCLSSHLLIDILVVRYSVMACWSLFSL